MPCRNITETLKILVDHDSCVIEYSLHKKTCYGEVGFKSLLGEWVKKRSVQEILNLSSDIFLKEWSTCSVTQEYLALKHFLAIQSGLSVLTGETSGNINDYCTVEAITYDAQGILLTAEISVPAITKAIEACGSCARRKLES